MTEDRNGLITQFVRGSTSNGHKPTGTRRKQPPTENNLKRTLCNYERSIIVTSASTSYIIKLNWKILQYRTSTTTHQHTAPVSRPWHPSLLWYNCHAQRELVNIDSMRLTQHIAVLFVQHIAIGHDSHMAHAVFIAPVDRPTAVIVSTCSMM